VHEQSRGFTDHEVWDFDRSAREQEYPLLLHAPYFDLYRRQVIKQADLVLAMLWYSDRFSPEDKARNVDYYERRTVRDSSLSACIQAVLAAEVGHLELAHDYTYEAAVIDLQDLHNNTGDGLHIASLAGAWIALVSGFGGLRVCSGELVLDPALPAGINRLCFGLRWLGMRLTVEVRPDQVTYSLRDGEHASMRLRHAGEQLTVSVGEPVTRRLTPRKPLLPPPEQPPGRVPLHRAAAADRTPGT
jgi:trehalose/maltose hydrolase-like predicted phosphorylase